MTRITFGFFFFLEEHRFKPRLENKDAAPAETTPAPTVLRKLLLFIVLLGFGMALEINKIHQIQPLILA
jgi:hypothetical protein